MKDVLKPQQLDLPVYLTASSGTGNTMHWAMLHLQEDNNSETQSMLTE